VAKLKAAVLLLVAAATAHADWAILSTALESGRAGVVHRHAVLENATGGGRAVVDLAIFAAQSCTLRIIQNRDGANNLAEAMAREKCLAGVNGGYFDADFAPIGLRIVDGQTIAPLRRARLITGALMASARGVQIVRVREFSLQQKVSAALQCGPFLVDSGKHVRGLDDSHPARRTFAATGTNDRALLGVCSEISLSELANILATTQFAEDLKIERALNLDGGSSSAFWFARENGSAFSIPEQKTVGDFVGVVPR
jgi:exopolysaccharide biosynthesis protein